MISSKTLSIYLACILLSSATASAAPFRVGNGDSGSDLEKLKELKSGPIIDARDKALGLLNHLNTASVAGLGALQPEIERSPVFEANDDTSAELSEDQGIFHADMRGQVFARTLPEAHAATRFFPIAKSLSTDQLVSLHIHEGLHRSLPASVRRDEAVVSAITLAITSPKATNDSIQAAAQRYIPESDRLAMSPRGAAFVASNGQGAQSEAKVNPVSEDSRLNHPSVFSYEYRHYKQPSDSDPQAIYPITAMHVIKSELFPFGDEKTQLGIGISGSFISRPTASQMGPFGLSLKGLAWSSRGFDLGFWAEGSFNVLSAEELKNSPLGRDTISGGISIKKDLPLISFENLIGFTLPGTAKQTLGAVEYSHQFGSVIFAQISAAARVGQFRLGAYTEINLADYYRVTGGAFSFDSGRYRLLSAGPRVSYEMQNMAVTLYGRFKVDASKDASFDYLGNLMGQGVAQGTIGANLSFYF